MEPEKAFRAMPVLYSFLFSHGYSPIHKSSSIIKASIRRSFGVFGETVPEVFFGYLSKIYGMPEDMLLLDYDLVERALKDLFRSGAEIALNLIRQNLVEAVPELDTRLTTRQMVCALLEKEAMEIVRNLASREHIILVHRSQDAKQRMISSFLDSQGAKGVIFSGDKQFGPGVEAIAYDRMAGVLEKTWSVEDFLKWSDSVKSKKVPGGEGARASRIVGEDSTWLLNNGFADELLSLEKRLGPRLDDERMSVLCAYDSRQTPPQYLQEVIVFHDYVITDEPMLVFRKSKA